MRCGVLKHEASSAARCGVLKHEEASAARCGVRLLCEIVNVFSFSSFSVLP
jgi:hypothetical protein